MTINFYKCSSDNHVLFKTFAPDVISKTGTLRKPCSVMDPVIEVEQGEEESDIFGFNYLEIVEFGRKYFIKNITSTVNGLWEIQAHIDVLETYKNQVASCYILAEDRESDPNMYIDGNLIPMEDRDVEQVIFFQGDDDNCFHHDGGEGETTGNTCFDDDYGWVYIIITQGPGATVPPPTP